MIHDFIYINSYGAICNRQNHINSHAGVFKGILQNIMNAPLQVSKIIMNKQDYDDILAWSKEDDSQLNNH